MFSLGLKSYYYKFCKCFYILFFSKTSGIWILNSKHYYNIFYCKYQYRKPKNIVRIFFPFSRAGGDRTHLIERYKLSGCYQLTFRPLYSIIQLITSTLTYVVQNSWEGLNIILPAIYSPLFQPFPTVFTI